MAWCGSGKESYLLNRLQDVEQSLANFMFETILKMETMTTTKVFLLLENPGGAKYGGTSDLVARFEDGLLRQDDRNNVLVQLDPSLHLLKEQTKPLRLWSAVGSSEHLTEVPNFGANLNGPIDETLQGERRPIDDEVHPFFLIRTSKFHLRLGKR